MRLDDLNWLDVENYLQYDNRLMLIIGSCEQHGYLSLLTDVKIPLALADAASEKTGVPIAPPLNFGSSGYFLAYPGTFSLRVRVLLDVVEDLVRSAYRHGFRRLLILNGHGGNEAARDRLFELATELSDIEISWYAWWQSHSIEQIALAYKLKPGHANWIEAFPFNRVSELPAESKMPPHVQGIMGADQARQVYGDGSFGGPYQTDPVVLQEIFEAALKDILVLLRFE